MRTKEMYGYKCEYCAGTVKKRLVKKEVFKHKGGFVMLEDIPVGVCDKCRYRYYHSTILKKVEDIVDGKQISQRKETIPVAHF
ncbi:MAG: YgiT-type zinc finger protein [Candidatus Anammoxibacter sp.]